MTDRRVALQQRINRIAADLAASTAKPLRFWLEETARMIARDVSWRIHDTPGGEVLVIVASDEPPPTRAEPARASDPDEPAPTQADPVRASDPNESVP